MIYSYTIVQGKFALTKDNQKIGLNENSLNQEFGQDGSPQPDKGNV
jgi:hypothetical protein